VVSSGGVVREPVDAGELTLRVGSLIARQVERRGLQKKIDQLAVLNRTTWAFSLAGGSETLFGQIAKLSADALRAEKGLVLLYDSQRREMQAQGPGFGLSREQAERVRYPVDGEPRDRWNFRINGPLLSNHAFSDAQLVLEDADLPIESRQEFMQTIMDQTDDLARLANDTLLISRMETGKIQYEWQDMELAPLILEAVPLGLSRHSVVTDVPAALPA